MRKKVYEGGAFFTGNRRVEGAARGGRARRSGASRARRFFLDGVYGAVRRRWTVARTSGSPRGDGRPTCTAENLSKPGHGWVPAGSGGPGGDPVSGMARSLFPPTNAFLTRLSLPVGKPPSLLGCDLARGGMTGANGNGNPEKFFFSGAGYFGCAPISTAQEKLISL